MCVMQVIGYKLTLSVAGKT